VHAAWARVDLINGSDKPASKPNGDKRDPETQVRSAEALEVSGQVFRDGKLVSTFSADKANADPDSQVLILTGHVVVVSVEHNATLHCDRLRYEARQKVYKAEGNVLVKTESGAKGTLSEAWATTDLTKVATPDLFGQKL
jgi:lipopolysaccharide assembly outer membrane protein LptD (OstA)